MRSTSGVMNGAAAEFSPAERNAVLAKLSAALQHIDEVSPIHGRLFRNYTRAIRARKSDVDLRFNSECATATVGEIRLRNPQLEHMTAVELAEALVHEGTHSFLATYEYVKQPFVRAAVERTLTSPWSGNAIPISSFCHAAFVWFALFHFATRELTALADGDERSSAVVRRRDRCAAGFSAPGRLTDRLMSLDPRPIFHDELLATIDTLQGLVRAASSGASSTAGRS